MLGRYILLGVLLLSGLTVVAFHGLNLVRSDLRSGELPGQSDNQHAAADWDEFTAEAGPWRIRGHLLERAAGKFLMRIEISDMEGNAAPPSMNVVVFLEMRARTGPSVPAQVRVTDDGNYLIEGSVETAGHWRAFIHLQDIVLQVSLDLSA